jgi:GNAT superfamily N-acetyltransferase
MSADRVRGSCPGSMLRSVDVQEVDPGDADVVRRLVEVANAVRRSDSPWEHEKTVHECQGELRHGWDGEPSVAFLGTDGDTAVAVGEYAISAYDNLHLARLVVEVHPEHRRKGYGTAMLDVLCARARSDGRTSVAVNGWESASTAAFAAAHGFDQKAVEIQRRQTMGDLDQAALDRLHDDARSHASSYELVRQLGPTPEDRLEAAAVMAAAINDAPTDDLDVEDEVYTPERVRAYELAQAGRGLLVHTVFARHVESGELAGVTTVVVDQERSHAAEQHDTSVVRAHRGHRLGLLLKLEMIRWLRETQPQVATVDTWNAESNDQMIGVNELLGYRVVGRALTFQRSLSST